MQRVLSSVMRRFISIGNLRVTSADGSSQIFGDGTGNRVAVRFTTRAAELGVLADPELRLGESYVDGTLMMEQGSIADLLAVVLDHRQSRSRNWLGILRYLRFISRRLRQLNIRPRSRRNVRRHYDLDDDLYRLFLDEDRQYSCAYFESPGQSLEDAQLAKKRHLAAKLCVRPRQRVLDIGCGWGGLALYLSEMSGAHVTGITLSDKQLLEARARATERGMSEHAEFRPLDYRDVSGTFDRIISVGMFEHVGVGFYDTFFQKCASLLDDQGVMVLSSIGRSEGPSVTNPWIEKYIFPGGYIPALSEVTPAIERAGLLVTGVEILRLHYARTLELWRDRFLAHRDKMENRYGERFVRMWEFYLAASEMTFREQAMMVFQLQLTKRQGVVPITRDYIARESARLHALELRRKANEGGAARSCGRETSDAPIPAV